MDPRELPPIERRSLRQASAHHYYIPSSHRAFQLLRWTFTLLALVAGVDKFSNLIVDWSVYLSPVVPAWFRLSAASFIRAAGVIEIVAGLITAFRPRWGGVILFFWFLALAGNLLSIPAFFDIAVGDIALGLGALALAFLSVEFEQYRGPGLR